MLTTYMHCKPFTQLSRTQGGKVKSAPKVYDIRAEQQQDTLKCLECSAAVCSPPAYSSGGTLPAASDAATLGLPRRACQR